MDKVVGGKLNKVSIKCHCINHLFQRKAEGCTCLMCMTGSFYPATPEGKTAFCQQFGVTNGKSKVQKSALSDMLMQTNFDAFLGSFGEEASTSVQGTFLGGLPQPEDVVALPIMSQERPSDIVQPVAQQGEAMTDEEVEMALGCHSELSLAATQVVNPTAPQNSSPTPPQVASPTPPQVASPTPIVEDETQSLDEYSPVIVSLSFPIPTATQPPQLDLPTPSTVQRNARLLAKRKHEEKGKYLESLDKDQDSLEQCDLVLKDEGEKNDTMIKQLQDKVEKIRQALNEEVLKKRKIETDRKVIANMIKSIDDEYALL